MNSDDDESEAPEERPRAKDEETQGIVKEKTMGIKEKTKKKNEPKIDLSGMKMKAMVTNVLTEEEFAKLKNRPRIIRANQK